MKELEEAYKDAATLGAGIWGGTATAGMIDSTLTPEKLLNMLENFKRVMQSPPAPSEWRIQANAYLPDFKMQPVSIKRYRLFAKGTRRKWAWKGETIVSYVKVPDHTAYQLADGTLVCSLSVADTIRKTIASKD